MSHVSISQSRKGVEILELGAQHVADSSNLLSEILKGLSQTKDCKVDGTSFKYSKSIPTVVLYDDKGLDIYDAITKEQEYYLYQSELDILKAHGPEIARSMFSVAEGTEESEPGHEQNNQEDIIFDQSLPSVKPDSKWGDYGSGVNNYGVNGNFGLSNATPTRFVIELGAGSLKKTSVLLRSLANVSKADKVLSTYYAVDLEHDQLVSTLDGLLDMEKDSVTAKQDEYKIIIKGARASYDDIRPNLSSESGLFSEHSKKALLWLGSSLGNFTRPEAADFLKAFSDSMQPGDSLLIGIDSTSDSQKIEAAYGDKHGTTEAFILNGLTHIERIFSDNKVRGNFSASKFEYYHRFNTIEGCHEAYVKAKEDVAIEAPDETINIVKGELILIERSFKYNKTEIMSLLDKVGMRMVQSWSNEAGEYSLSLVEKPTFFFHSTQPQLAEGKNPFGVPTLADWKRLWNAFDCVTLDCIPKSMLHTKPIDLRHICLFYIGHIPTFLQIHLSKALKEEFTKPANYTLIFERGIDPNMDNPEQCHDHSIVPEKQEDWPTLEQILDYRDRVRQRLTSVYEEGRLEKVSLENRRLARAICMVHEHEAMHLETLLYMLLQKSEAILPPPGFSKPRWTLLARQWDSQALEKTPILNIPASSLSIGQDDRDSEDFGKPLDETHVFGWDNENGRRTIDVPAFRISALPITNKEYLAFLVKQDNAEEWIPSSWYTLDSGDASYGIRVLYSPGYVDFQVGQHWPVQASGKQLVQYAEWKGGRLPTEPELRVYLSKIPTDSVYANVGFKNWHPVPAALPVLDRDGKYSGGHNGGVWEWTSTPFETYDGFSSSQLYPGYSSDFFDGTHTVVVGGSWATIPRLAGRPSFRNWYQTQYPYVFAGARVAFDA